jgi:hypothetical protein
MMTTSLFCLYRMLGTAAGYDLERSEDWVALARYRSRGRVSYGVAPCPFAHLAEHAGRTTTPRAIPKSMPGPPYGCFSESLLENLEKPRRP